MQVTYQQNVLYCKLSGYIFRTKGWLYKCDAWSAFNPFKEYMTEVAAWFDWVSEKKSSDCQAIFWVPFSYKKMT